MSNERVIWRHKRRGTAYQIVGHAELRSAGGHLEEGQPLTIYRSIEDGKLWARPTSEFNDGRFERVGPKTLPEHAATLKLPDGFVAWSDFVIDVLNIRGPDGAIVGRITRAALDDSLGQREADKIVEAARELAK